METKLESHDLRTFYFDACGFLPTNAGLIESLLMSADLGFTYRVRKSGEVLIERNGQEVTVLRGESASAFLRKVSYGDPQQLMARVTGKYKRGNEKRN